MTEKLYRIKTEFEWFNPYSGYPDWWRANTPLGYLSVAKSYDGMWCWSHEHTVNDESEPCDSLEHGKILAQAWFAERMREGLDEVPTSPPRQASLYPDDRYCDHCDKDTPHEVFDSGHERDSSNDWRRCLECGWGWTGRSGKYEPPEDDDNEQ